MQYGVLIHTENTIGILLRIVFKLIDLVTVKMLKCVGYARF